MSRSPGGPQRAHQHMGSANRKFGKQKKIMPNWHELLGGDIA